MVGAVAGGAAGHVAGEAIDPTLENSYWEANYKTRRYVDAARPYADYQDAYRYGWESRLSNPSTAGTRSRRDLAKGWEKARGKSLLAWEKAEAATKDAWYRSRRLSPADTDQSPH